MKIAGSNTLPYPVAQVWDALLDPQVLVATIPGCERLETTGDHAYSMTVTAGVAAIKGTYSGSCSLSDLHEHESMTMHLQGAGAPGTIDATVGVRFSEPSPGVTAIAYEADAVVGGMVGGVGQRMLAGASRRMAGEFFGNVGRAVAAPATAPATASPLAGTLRTADPVTGAPVFTAPARPPDRPPARPGGLAVGSQDGFVKGVVVGAGLVLLGVVAGGLLGRRCS